MCFFSSPEKILTEARFHFSLKCLKTVMCLKKKENIVFSPYSIYEGLLLIYLASRDDIALHLRNKLELPDYIHQKSIPLDWILHSKIKKSKEVNNFIAFDWITALRYVNDIAKNLCMIYRHINIFRASIFFHKYPK